MVLFGLAELCQWIKEFSLLDHSSLPLPVLIGAGLALAIASNSTKRAGLPWQSLPTDFSTTEAQSDSEALPQLPVLKSDQIESAQISDQSISFTIHKHSFPQEP